MVDALAIVETEGGIADSLHPEVERGEVLLSSAMLHDDLGGQRERRATSCAADEPQALYQAEGESLLVVVFLEDETLPIDPRVQLPATAIVAQL